MALILYAAIPAGAQTTPNDYDTDDDNLIEVSTLDQLNAIRWDLNGDGDPTSANTSTYYAAFPNPVTTTRMGCAATCTGYELDANLNFDADNSGSVTSTDPYPNWAPIGDGSPYTAEFNGNGRTISNLTINNADVAGLFHSVASGGIIRDVGIIDPNVTSSGIYVAALASGISAGGSIVASYVQGGSITLTSRGSGGGLAGFNSGVIKASYSTASIDAGTTTRAIVGGLVGTEQNGTTTASYAAGAVSGTGADSDIGGFAGRASGVNTTITNSYCNTTVLTPTTTPCIGDQIGNASVTVEGKTASELQAPTGYTGIYSDWNVDIDNDFIPDNPWNFGTSSQLPAILAPGQRTVDHDADNDGLIDVDTLQKLNAIRYDLDGDGLPSATSVYAAYAEAFIGGDLAAPTSTRMGCVSGCTGYELTDDLDFDADSSGSVTSTDPYPNWAPIGGSYTATFDGRGHTISNLTITGNSGNTGLFRILGSGGVIRDLGMIDASISSDGTYVGVLAGGINPGGIMIAVSVQSGSVAVTTSLGSAGGLAGYNSGIIRAGYSRASVSGTGGNPQIGGLMGLSSGTTTASYAAGPVSASVGADIGGFVGQANPVAVITDSYCDTTVHSTATPCVGPGSATVEGKTAAELQTPTGYTGIYANWNINLDTGGTSTPSYPWYFGTTSTYPVLNNPAQRLAQRTGIAPPPPPTVPTSTPATSTPPTSPTSTPATSTPPTSPTSTPATPTPPTSPTSTPATSTPPTSPTSTPATSTPPTSPTSTPATSTPPTSPTSTPATSTPPTTPTSTPATSTPPDSGNGGNGGGNGNGGSGGETGGSGGDTAPPPAPPSAIVSAVEVVETYDAETAHPEIYANAQYEMTASCETHDPDPETGDPRSATITFDLGSYDGPILLTLSIWRNERYMAYETQDIPLPSLERDGRTATVRVETDPAQTRFRLDGRRHGLAFNLVLGYGDCRVDGGP